MCKSRFKRCKSRCSTVQHSKSKCSLKFQEVQ